MYFMVISVILYKIGEHNMVIIDKISALLKEQGKTQKMLCQHLGVTGNVYTNWKLGLSNSYKKYLPEIAEYLDVSVDNLLGKNEKEDNLQKYDLSSEQLSVILRYGALTDSQKKAVSDLLDSMLNS